MTIIISAEKNGYTNEAQGGTLEELRKQLIDEAIDTNKNMDDWLDQVEAVYPRDESELDEDEAPLTPRPLTEELLEALACHVWDVPTITWDENEEEPITRGELQATQHLLGLDTNAMARTLGVARRTYARWVAGTAPIPLAISGGVRDMLDGLLDDVDTLADMEERGAILVYPSGPEEQQQLDGRSLEWEQAACRLAMAMHGATLHLGDEA